MTVAGSAGLAIMPGTLARWYEAMGGSARLMGKPDPGIFNVAAQIVGADVPRERILVVGDSLVHDVAGAACAGMRSLFVAGGIHAAALGMAAAGWGEEDVYGPPAEAVAALAASEGAPEPDYSTSYLRW